MMEINFTEIWQRQKPEPATDMAAVMANAKNLKRRTKFNISTANLLLLATMVFIISVVMY